MSEGAPQQPAIIWHILASVALVAFFAVTAVITLFSPMAFDAPGSIENAGLVSFVFYVVAGPLVAALAFIVGWVRVAQGQRVSALKWMLLLPLVWSAGLAAWMALLSTVCRGDWSCGL